MIQLKKISSRAPKGYDKTEYKNKRIENTKAIGEQAEMLAANGDRSILVILQGMDSSGKNGITDKVFRYCSPAYTHCHSFKKPTELEFAHDFLWRVHQVVPAKGNIMIFNRSHYEDILIQRVHQWIDEDKVDMRMDAINAFEKLLQEDGKTTIIKMYLHISKDRQEEKLQERIDVPEKNYKHNDGDWAERKHWDRYMECYEDAINRSTIPWHVIPADQRWYRDYIASEVVLSELKKLNQSFPALTTKPTIG